MEWNMSFTINSDELIDMIERIGGEPLTDEQKDYVTDFMTNALAGISEAGHPSRTAMLAQTAGILAEQIKSGAALAARPSLMGQFPEQAPDDRDPPPA